MASKLDEMIRMLDEAVEQQAVHGCCRAVKDTLEKIVLSGEAFVPEEYLRPAPDKYVTTF